MTTEITLEQDVQEWLRLDRNPATRKYIEDLWKAKQMTDLEACMRPRLEFGTAGLRGPMRAGWAGLNDLMAVQTFQGIGAYAASAIDNAYARGVVIGYDHRHNSRRWAEMAAESFAHRGFQVHFLHGFSFTPLVPFAVTRLRAAVGCMITASHNPGGDNGIKIYWENGVQIIAPHDDGISVAISQALEPLTWELLPSTALRDCTEEIHDAYYKTVLPPLLHGLPHVTSKVKIVHTSLHGVAEPFMRKAFALLSDVVEVYSVPEQQHPDPDFPTTPYPNPEEKGALDLAMAYADKIDASYVFANDPDADRFAVAEKTGQTWSILTGNETGILLAAAILQWNLDANADRSKLAMLTTVVSSRMLRFMADKEGFQYRECLTGFKNLGNLAEAVERQGLHVAFSYEEALGYALSPFIKDKDGISAALVFAQILVKILADQDSLHSRLQLLYSKYGYFISDNSSIRCNTLAISNKFSKIRKFNSSQNQDYPTSLAGLSLTRIIDHTTGYDSNDSTQTFSKSAGQMIQFTASSQDSAVQLFLTIRASGTEPKIKYYLEVTGMTKDQLSFYINKAHVQLLEEWLC